MTDLFLKVLNLSFSATWVVLGVVLARLLLKKAPRNLVCALWALVALRLLFGGIDFDFISESLLPTQCEKGGAPLAIGHMNYDVILVPGCETLRASTMERLEAFAAIIAASFKRFSRSAPVNPAVVWATF